MTKPRPFLKYVFYSLFGILGIVLVGFVVIHDPRALLWYVVITMIGALAFPIANLMFSSLSDRGFAFSRALGLLIWGYSYWLFGVLGFINNDYGGLLLGIFILLGLSIWAYRKKGKEKFLHSLHDNKKVIINIEILFALSYFVIVLIRGYNPEIMGTEKPMELAFINAILRSPRFPPLDPWLSGHAISYYHFGYILVAMLAKFTGTISSVAFNLSLAMLFAMSAIGAYGLLVNLLSKRNGKEGARDERNVLAAWLAPFYVLIVSNLEGVLHLLHNRGFFWKVNDSGEQVSKFWTWIDIRNLDLPPQQPFTPLTSKFWSWWQASRVIRDYDFNGVDKGDVINEFPMFSYILGDLHPHILAMPFAFLAIAFAMNLLFRGEHGKMRWFGLRLSISPGYFYLSALAIGALSFLNTWDYPFYVALFAGAYAMVRVRQHSTRWIALAKDFFSMAIALGVTGLVFFIPFFLSFSSQAGGILPNLIYITRGVHFWIMFGPFLIPILLYLFFLWRKNRNNVSVCQGMKITLWLVIALLGIMLILVGAIAVLPILQSVQSQASMAPQVFLASMAAPDWGSVIGEGFKRRFQYPGTLLTMFILFSLLFGLLMSRLNHKTEQDYQQILNSSDVFALLMLLIGGLLVFAPEFVFLRDLFGYRINTIFKFYFQAWLLWSIVAAYGTVMLARSLKKTPALLFELMIIVVLGLTLVYPYYGLLSKTNGFNSVSGWTLDGTAYIQQASPDEAAAMKWLQKEPLGVIAEAVGGSYTNYGRMSVNSGQPTVLGWEFHEIQWRGNAQKLGSRRFDIERLYCSNSWEETKAILEKYNIRYIVVGQLERSTYVPKEGSCPSGIQVNKFIQNLQKGFEKENVVIYLVP